MKSTAVFWVMSLITAWAFCVPVYADVDYAQKWELYNHSGGTNDVGWGQYVDRKGIGYYQLAASSTDYYFGSTTAQLVRKGDPTDYVYGVLWNDTTNALIATSTNWFEGSIFGTVYGTTRTFHFAPTLIPAGTELRVGFLRSGTQNTSNYYGIRADGTSGQWCQTNTGYACYMSVTYGYANSVFTAYGILSVTPTYLTDADMATLTALIATTTEYILWASYFNQIFWGLLFMIIAGVAGYVFTRKFVR